MNFNAQLQQKAQLVNTVLQQLLASQPIDSELKEVLRYTLEGPGKRIRSALVLWSCELVSPPKAGINRNSEIAAAAMEMVHTYSLVHDDLPAMDNDDLRRGRPTCHKAFDEATAILAGDALLTLAFEVLAKEVDKPAIAVKLIGELAEAAGPGGMIAGQLADMKFMINDLQPAIGKQKLEVENKVKYIHTNKTAKLFRCAAAMGAICGGANEKQYKNLCEYGLKLGLGFQIADDILDVSASSEQLGKTAGKDASAGKTTYPAVVGVKKSKHLAKKLADESIAALKSFGHKADTLRELAIVLLERTK